MSLISVHCFQDNYDYKYRKLTGKARFGAFIEGKGKKRIRRVCS